MPDSIPLDTSRVQFLGLASVSEHFEFDTVAKARKTEQTRVNGVPVWTLDVMMIGAGRPEVIGVRVPSVTRPDFNLHQPVELERPVVSMYPQRKGRDGMQIAFNYEAAGIKNATPQRQGEKAA